MNVVTVVGARPQFIKASPVSRALRARGHREYLVHTGQHYDRAMSAVFFEEMAIPAPDINLEVGSGSHAQMTAAILTKLEAVLLERRPAAVIVYGDTNSTLAAALAASQLRLPLAHVEAGLRSFNRAMPEEHNRVVADHLADVLFCPTRTAVENLRAERISERVHLVGDTMLDALRTFEVVARERSRILADLKLEAGSYAVATLHRPYNTDDPAKLAAILAQLDAGGAEVILPLHPRTAKAMRAAGIAPGPRVRVVEPLGYLDMLCLLASARMIVTDSGGIQKEAFFLRVPCLTVRPETEWVETLEGGWNALVEPAALGEAIRGRRAPDGEPPPVFGHGDAAGKIVSVLESLPA